MHVLRRVFKIRISPDRLGEIANKRIYLKLAGALSENLRLPEGVANMAKRSASNNFDPTCGCSP